MGGGTNLALDASALIITVRGCPKHLARATHTDIAISGCDASSLGKVLFSLGLPDLDLLLLATTTELVRLEGIFGLELSAAVLGNVSLGHGEDQRDSNCKMEGRRLNEGFVVQGRRAVVGGRVEVRVRGTSDEEGGAMLLTHHLKCSQCSRPPLWLFS
jgi:hypothetical protein